MTAVITISMTVAIQPAAVHISKSFLNNLSLILIPRYHVNCQNHSIMKAIREISVNTDITLRMTVRIFFFSMFSLFIITVMAKRSSIPKHTGIIGIIMKNSTIAIKAVKQGNL